jgi:phosphatidylserine/phosphatidylglycerophosphate/cardiolipin synthase-like enzyme
MSPPKKSPTVVSPAYGAFPIHPLLNFVPAENFGARARPLYDAETQAIDVIMYKIIDSVAPDAMIRAVKRAVPVRIIVEPTRYRNPANTWQAYYLDKMWAAGVQIRNRKHLGFPHQKTALLYSQARTIFGSSNWSTASSKTQYEHNYFATDSVFFNWFRQVFMRKWASTTETTAFVPLPPDVPVYVAPANTAGGQTTTVVLSWKPGLWARTADVYLGTSSSPALYLRNVSGQHAWSDQEVDSYRPAARRIVLLEDRVEDRRQQVRERADVEFWDVRRELRRSLPSTRWAPSG